MTRKAVVLFAACWTLAMAGGRLAFGADIPEVNPLSGNEKAINEGKSWFRSVCSACHGGRADGAGERGTGADLRKFNLGFRRFVETVKDGRQVQGRAQVMPAWGAVLDQKTIYEIGAYLETLAIDGANWKEGVQN